MAHEKVSGRTTSDTVTILLHRAGMDRSSRKGSTYKQVKGTAATSVPRVSHLSCCRSSGDSEARPRKKNSAAAVR